jgi:hypothetical protein
VQRSGTRRRRARATGCTHPTLVRRFSALVRLAREDERPAGRIGALAPTNDTANSLHRYVRCEPSGVNERLTVEIGGAE